MPGGRGAGARDNRRALFQIPGIAGRPAHRLSRRAGQLSKTFRGRFGYRPGKIPASVAGREDRFREGAGGHPCECDGGPARRHIPGRGISARGGILAQVNPDPSAGNNRDQELQGRQERITGVDPGSQAAHADLPRPRGKRTGASPGIPGGNVLRRGAGRGRRRRVQTGSGARSGQERAPKDEVMPRLLKQLELSGFKSFASKTVFDFSSGITAIVGPNGSGKSNVIDGIRWLLGEREAKNLRGAKSEDLIFAGTPNRPRLGQAQASLHFWNKDNFFPVDFEEITVSRQVSRGGANKYFLNKAEVRLKDIVDFFAQARLGTKGLVVITQGNSDVFIQAMPEGRREMIEEMLGLREYQLKKSEAERRLRNTQINLDKVRALTEEILPHLRSLKRQTHRWEKRETLAEELAGLEDQYFGIERRELQQKFSEAEANLKKVESSQPEERRELQAIKRETQALLEKRSGLEKELGRLEVQLEMAAKPAARADAPRAGALLELVKKIKTKLEIALDDPEKLSEAVNQILEDIEGALSGDEPAAPKKEGPSGEIEERFRNIRKDLEDLEKEMVSLKGKEQNLEKNQEQFYSAFKQAVAGLEAAKDRLEKWESENQKLLFEKERLNLRREEWERQVRQAERSPEDFREPVRIPADFEPLAAEKRILRLRGELASMGEIDEALVKEARETEERYEFLKKESEDLDKARADLKRLISDLNEKIGTEFGSALVRINEEFHKFFGLMFGGGQAKLTLEKPKHQ